MRQDVFATSNSDKLRRYGHVFTIYSLPSFHRRGRMKMSVMLVGPCDHVEGLECIVSDFGDAVDALDRTKESCPEDNHDSSVDFDVVKVRRKLLFEHLRQFFRFGPKKKSNSVATASTAADSIWSETSSLAAESTSIASSSEPEPPIKERIEASGIQIEYGKHYDFIRDHVSKEVIGMYKDGPAEEENIKHVKTGLWQITEISDDGEPQPPFYIVTAVLMEDTVDAKKIRKAVFAGKKNKRRPKIKLAPTEIAEKLAGFQSGTMAPICHLEKMKLYLEESIVDRSEGGRRVAVGCGAFGRCLAIDLDKFLQVAEKQGLEIRSIVGKKKKQPKE